MSFKNVLIVMFFLLFSSFIYSESIGSNMTSGIESYRNGDFINSIYYFNLVLNQESEYNNEALFWKAKSYYNLGYYGDSKDNLESFFKQSDINTSYYEDARFLYCKVYFKLEKFNDALLLFNQFSRNKSFVYYNESVLFWIGECYLQLSELENANKAYTRYLELNPNSKNVKDRLALIVQMQKLLVTDDDEKINIEEKANWFTEYVVLESRNSEDKTISNLLANFNDKREFFKWIDNYIDKLKKKNENATIEKNVENKKNIIEDTKELDLLEQALLDDLEYQLLNKLGDEIE